MGIAIAFGGFASRVNAEPPETAPAPLKETLAAIDKAASSHNVQSVLAFYSPTFTHSDGLTRQTLEQALTQLWKRYPNLTYRTELKSWKAEGNGITAQTVTYVTGAQKMGDRELKIDSTLQAQQQFENQKIVRQEILAERSQITSGTNPPNVKLNLPEQVNAGQAFSFDAVVQEPLGNDLLLGTALEEPVKADGFVNPTTVDLELLSAGGLFKVGRAPLTADSRWISAVLVRQDGMTMITQRLRVVNRVKAPQ
ncbi:MAG: nuclear transport factor 2 family protein [Tildeniella nuda ZEHNDER 1965/U140]|nr:nuclear transport factor 2 family protein [Tildeniella nuda ZEHNDER 1965/U140]